MNSKRRRSNRKAAGRQSPDQEQAQVEALGTPPKRVRLNVAEGQEAMVQVNQAIAASTRVVTPRTTAASSSSSTRSGATEEGSSLDTAAKKAFASPARRSLFTPAAKQSDALPTAVVTPSRESVGTISARRQLVFGRMVDVLPVQKNVRQVYKIVKRLTGSLGGNASSGPIYGELTMNSMQRMINLMKEHTGFCAESRFIDVGSGIGKPNLHVAQDPGVSFSYGIEVEEARWLLGMTCLNGVLASASSQAKDKLGEGERILHRCVFEKGDIRQAKIFDPFTHVYMFSIGFPPTLWLELAEIWNRSSSPYLICYHAPKDIIETYEFDVELIAQKPTSMHGSKEGHMGYIYKRKPGKPFKPTSCDPLFRSAFEKAGQEVTELQANVQAQIGRLHVSGPYTRARRSR